LKASVGKERNFMAKRDAFKFPIVHFPFICSNIPAAPAYGIEIFQLVRYSIACGFYQYFRDIIMVAVNKKASLFAIKFRSLPTLAFNLWVKV
jgi:hypothetical protein